MFTFWTLHGQSVMEVAAKGPVQLHLLLLEQLVEPSAASDLLLLILLHLSLKHQILHVCVVSLCGNALFTCSLCRHFLSAHAPFQWRLWPYVSTSVYLRAVNYFAIYWCYLYNYAFLYYYTIFKWFMAFSLVIDVWNTFVFLCSPQYFTCLLLIFIAQVTAGVLIYFQRDRVRLVYFSFVSSGLNSLVHNFHFHLQLMCSS